MAVTSSGVTTVWHVIIDGTPACTAPCLAPDERLEPPVCGSRNRARVEEYAELLRGRHPGSTVDVVAYGCPMRGE
jgi:hypothetical protein